MKECNRGLTTGSENNVLKMAHILLQNHYNIDFNFLDIFLPISYSLFTITWNMIFGKTKSKSKLGGDTLQCIQKCPHPFHSGWARLLYIALIGSLVHCTTNLLLPQPSPVPIYTFILLLLNIYII